MPLALVLIRSLALRSKLGSEHLELYSPDYTGGVVLQALRCRCKHKHTDHDPNTRECKKPKCSCKCFDSPWVCNCDHGWAEHDHVLVKKEVPDLSSLGVQEADLADSIAPEVNNYAALKRGAGYNDCAFP